MSRPLEHLSDGQLEAFSKRSAAPAGLVDIDGHLSACEECRRRLEKIAPAGALYAGIRNALEQDAAVGHLSYEDVRDAAEGKPSQAAVRHLESCQPCREEVADLAQFIPALASEPRAKRPVPVPPVWRWAIAAILLAGLLPFAWWAWRRSYEPRYRLALHDGGAVVALDSAGKLHTPSPVPPVYAAQMQRALMTGRLPVPESYRRAQPEVLLGSKPSPGPLLTIRHPSSEAVLTGRPRFEWTAPPGAGRYRVSVYDRAFRQVAQSPELNESQWIPPDELAAGQQYTWVVTARVAQQEVRAPVPPAPEARFTVLSRAEAASLEQLQRQYPDQHLMLAVSFAQAGVLSIARQEVEALARANPASPVVLEMEASLNAESAHPAPSSTKPAQ
ncbi:MAG TPA: hypothetical protein VMG35_12660 [Bryobacteraceae bacterium]|nr:hypothetical protein [Bryobacteraceae bacterium]